VTVTVSSMRDYTDICIKLLNPYKTTNSTFYISVTVHIFIIGNTHFCALCSLFTCRHVTHTSHIQNAPMQQNTWSTSQAQLWHGRPLKDSLWCLIHPDSLLTHVQTSELTVSVWQTFSGTMRTEQTNMQMSLITDCLPSVFQDKWEWWSHWLNCSE